MKKTLLFLLITGTVYPWHIESFIDTVLVKKDGAIVIKENIEVDFEGGNFHGIFRIIPIEYKKGLSRYNLRFQLRSVKDERGRALKVRERRWGRYIELRIGDPDRYAPNNTRYSIKYELKRAVNIFEDRDEIYLNITGNEWDVPINNTQAVVFFGEGINAESGEFFCFTGRFGSKENDCKVKTEGNMVSFRTGYLSPGEGFTVLALFPKGTINSPSLIQNILWFLQDNRAYLLPFLTLFIMAGIWYRNGRDPGGKPVAQVTYAPPEELPPAELGTLIDEKVDASDISSIIIDLARRGYIKIREHKEEGFLFFKKKDYSFELLKDYTNGGEDIRPYEKKLLDAIFIGAGIDNEFKSAISGGLTDTYPKWVKVSSLRNKFYKYIPEIKRSIYSSLVKKKLFPMSPEMVRRLWLAIGGALVFAGFFITFVFGERADLGFISWFLSFGISGAIVSVFSFVMPRKTRRGVRLYELSLGFKEFIERVEKDRIKRLYNETPGIFEKILPYAVALNLQDRWVEAFHGLMEEAPGWFVSPTGRMIAFSDFTSGFSNALSLMSSNLASAPRGSGAGGGGGFSGGGFGGGGGGAW